MSGPRFNPPPGWPKPPEGWVPPAGWSPDPSWPPAPPGWELWIGSDSISPPQDPASSDEPAQPRQPVATSDADSTDAAGRLAQLEAENALLRTQLAAGGFDAQEVVELEDERVLQDAGLYEYHHPLENADAYKDRLTDLRSRIKDLVRTHAAIEMSSTFTFENSLAKGRKMTTDLSKLMLRAYNAEADNCVRTLRAGNVVTAEKRLEASRAAIMKLGQMMEMHISHGYHALRLEEIQLTADWLMKKQEEREAAREERARIREEKKIEKELAEERARLDKERAHLEAALSALRANGEEDEALESRLAAIDDAITQNDFRAANIRAGYVYVISNRGAFGKGVVKIGLTRRLEPNDRIVELGGASVPFRFDVHALFFSEDAVALEADLHRHFAERAVNRANSRKEFFFADPLEVRDVLRAKVGNLLEFTEQPEATEYFQSVKYWPRSNDPHGPSIQRESAS